MSENRPPVQGGDCLPLRRSDLDLYVLSLDISKLAERLAKRSQQFWPTDEKEADAPHSLALLRVPGKRPRRRSTEKRDELAPSHFYIST
jgi:hypothetical protein